MLLEFFKKVEPGTGAKTIGPYSPATISATGVCYSSGQIGLDPATGALVDGGIEAQTRQALENLQAVLQAGGYSMHQVVKTTVFLTTMDDFAAMNGVYAAFFREPYPARSTVAVAGMPKGALVEIEAVAVP